MNGFVGGYYRFSVWITNLAYVNFLWIFFTIAGLGIFGFMPATAAMFAVIRKLIMKEDITVFKTFWKYFWEEFVKINILGAILLLIGYILFIEFQILWGIDQLAYLVASFGVIAIFMMYIIVLLYFFPIYVHFDLTKREYIKWPIIIGVIHPILTVFLIIAVGFLHYFAFMTIPALIFFFGGSCSAYILTWGAFKTFPKYENVKATSASFVKIELKEGEKSYFT